MSDLSDLLRRAASAQRLAQERSLLESGLSPAQHAVLDILRAAPGLSGADISRLERLTPPTVSVILANLERKGAVIRRRSVANARVQEWRLTELGESMSRAGSRAMESYNRRVAAAANDEASLRRWLAAVAELEV